MTITPLPDFTAEAKPIDPGLLRAVICDRCSAPTGEYALDRHGICKGCEDRGVEPWANGHGHHASADHALDDWDVPSCRQCGDQRFNVSVHRAFHNTERVTFIVNAGNDDDDPEGILYYDTDDRDWTEDDARDSTDGTQLETVLCCRCGEPYDGPSENVS